MSTKTAIEVLHTEAALTNAMAHRPEEMDVAESSQNLNINLPNTKLKSLVWTKSARRRQCKDTTAAGTPEAAAAQSSLESVTPMELSLIRNQGDPPAVEVEMKLLTNMVENLPSISAVQREADAGGASTSGSSKKNQTQKSNVEKLHRENQRYVSLLTNIVGSCPENFLSSADKKTLRDLTQAVMTGKYE